DGTETERGGVQVPEIVGANRSKLRSGVLACGRPRDDAGGERYGARERGLGGEREARTDAGMREEVGVLESFRRRAAERGADEPSGFRDDGDNDGAGVGGWEGCGVT